MRSGVARRVSRDHIRESFSSRNLPKGDWEPLEGLTLSVLSGSFGPNFIFLSVLFSIALNNGEDWCFMIFIFFLEVFRRTNRNLLF